MKANRYFLIPIILFFISIHVLPIFSEDYSSNSKHEDLPTLGPISSSNFDKLTNKLEEILEQNSAIRPLYWRYTKEGSIPEGYVDMQVSLNIWATGALRQKTAVWNLELEYDPLTWEIIDFRLGRTDYDPFYPDEQPEEYYLDMIKAAELEEMINNYWYENLLDLLNIRSGIASENGDPAITDFANARIYSGYGDGGGSSGFSYELYKE